MKKKILVGLATLLVIFISTLVSALELPYKSCIDIACDGYSGCVAKKAVHSSCKITCYDDDVLFCEQRY